jgi:putative SOS response-associated peptidase YedK
MGPVCGRYVSAGDLADLSVLLGIDPFARDVTDEEEEAARQRRFNLAPTDPVPAVLPGEQPGSRQLTLVSWGLVPPWSDPSTGAQRINARVETVLDKPSFRRAVRSRRCLLPADGWYEWVREPSGRRQPYLVRPVHGDLLLFAGLHERWHAPDGSTRRTSAILTGPAPEPLAWLHERAPLAVPPELWTDWLDPSSDAEALLTALREGPQTPMSVQAVSSAVNNVRNSGPELLRPVEIPTPPEQVALW